MKKLMVSICISCSLLLLTGCGSYKDTGDPHSLTWEKVEVSAPLNTGYDSDLTTGVVTIHREEIPQQWERNVSFINLGAIDTQQMASVVGFYDAVWNQLNYSWKQESSFSCRDQNKREKPDCAWYTLKYPPFSFSFLSTKESPSAEVASGELLLRTKNYTITVKKYEYSDLKLFERDIQREFDENSDYCLYTKGATQTMYGIETETTYPVRLSQGEGQEWIDPSAPSVESFSGAKMFGWTWGLGKNLNQMFTEGKIIYIPLARKKNGSCMGADRVGHLILFKDQKVFYTIISDMREDIFIYNGIYETPFSVDVIE